MSDDLISKRALLKKTRRMYAPDEIDSIAPIATSCVTVDDICRAAVVDAVPVVHGRWIRSNDEQAYFDVEYVCNECQFVVAVSGIGTPILYGYKYCPNCGARMDGGDNE